MRRLCELPFFRCDHNRISKGYFPYLPLTATAHALSTFRSEG